MVDNASEYMIKVVDDLLDTLTNGEHRRTIKALETDIDKSSVRMFLFSSKIGCEKYSAFKIYFIANFIQSSCKGRPIRKICTSVAKYWDLSIFKIK